MSKKKDAAAAERVARKAIRQAGAAARVNTKAEIADAQGARLAEARTQHGRRAEYTATLASLDTLRITELTQSDILDALSELADAVDVVAAGLDDVHAVLVDGFADLASKLVDLKPKKP